MTPSGCALMYCRLPYMQGHYFPFVTLLVMDLSRSVGPTIFNKRCIIYIISTTWERPSVPIIGFLRSLYAVLGGA